MYIILAEVIHRNWYYNKKGITDARITYTEAQGRPKMLMSILEEMMAMLMTNEVAVLTVDGDDKASMAAHDSSG